LVTYFFVQLATSAIQDRNVLCSVSSSIFIEHFHAKRDHQGKENRRLFVRPDPLKSLNRGVVQCQERLCGYSSSITDRRPKRGPLDPDARCLFGRFLCLALALQ
jgi:hypothetical protein